MASFCCKVQNEAIGWIDYRMAITLGQNVSVLKNLTVRVRLWYKINKNFLGLFYTFHNFVIIINFPLL